MVTTDAQKRAYKKYNKKQSGRPRLPGIYLTDEENELLVEMSEIYGSKKEAIFKGLELLKHRR
jgi:hypothetical protein